MKPVAIMETKSELRAHSVDTIIRFEEGLIGFLDCKSFVLMENADIKPFRKLQSTERPDIGFLVIDPSLVLKDFEEMIPSREWEALGLSEPCDRIALAICIIGRTPAESTGNLQAPLLVNYKNMVGRQVILTETPLSSRHPLA